MSRTPSPVELVALYGLLGIMVVLVAKGRRDPAASGLPKGQRVRPLALEVLDPILSMVVVGGLLAHQLSRGWPHVTAALVGGALGVPIGLGRAKVMFVKALSATRSVVLQRSAPEYVLLGILLVLRAAEEPLGRITAGPLTLVLTALVSLAVGESFVRAGGIIARYRAEVAREGGPPIEVDGDAAGSSGPRAW